MTEISFYHLTKSPLQQALPQLLEKILASGKRAVVLCVDKNQLTEIDKLLWTYRPESFLAHGSKKDGHTEKQPIYLTVEEENPNNADFLVNLSGDEPNFLANFERCLDIFNGHNDEEVAQARNRWKSYQSNEVLSPTYWKQDDNGRWSKPE